MSSDHHGVGSAVDAIRRERLVAILRGAADVDRTVQELVEGGASVAAEARRLVEAVGSPA